MSGLSQLEMSAFGRVSCPAADFPASEAAMAATERISMTMRELDRFKIIQDVTASSSRGVQPNGWN
ncbi:hypothetical protein LGM31_00325 [Burkholderia vietnamiensis]|nr:hypothetical protein [Burkholderia vietnamiensis]KVR96062.1 hypothetical protein WK29_04875 [Burkholderia vietnamiensis]MCA7982303.1 hypothetical protein [Burkholderia vietnamiensis]